VFSKVRMGETEDIRGVDLSRTILMMESLLAFCGSEKSLDQMQSFLKVGIAIDSFLKPNWVFFFCV